MSQWTHIQGSVVSKKVSMKKIIKEVLDGEDMVFHFEGDGQFSGRFERTGDPAIEDIQKIIKKIKSFDPQAKGHVEINTVMDF